MDEHSKPSPLSVLVPVALAVAVSAPLLRGGSSYDVLMVLLAVAPGLVILAVFISQDRFPEPSGVICWTFILGVLAPIPVVLLAVISARLFDGAFAVFGPFGVSVAEAFLHAAIPEETVKFCILMLYCARHSEFDEPMDGLVYGVTASLGFATLENVAYVLQNPQWPGWMETALLRAATSVPSHAADGAVMGFFVGLSYALPNRRRQFLGAAWAVPVLFHGAYDLLLFVGGASGLWLSVFLMEVGVARRMLRKLKAVQLGENPETVAQQVWRAARREVPQLPASLEQPMTETEDQDVASIEGDDAPVAVRIAPRGWRNVRDTPR